MSRSSELDTWTGERPVTEEERSAKRSQRAGLARRACFAALLGLLLCSCTQVDAGPDLERTARLIGERTGHSGLIDPTADQQSVEAAVDKLLNDGLSIDEAVAVALLNNPDLAARFQDVGVSAAALVAAGTLSNPRLFVSARFPEGGGRNDLSLSISQNVIDFLLIPVRKQQAALDLEASRLGVARAAVELVADVKQACYRVLALDRARVLAEELQQVVRHSLDVSERALAAGQADVVDVDQARADALDARRQLLGLVGERTQAELVLRHLLGLSRRSEPLSLHGELPRQIELPSDEVLASTALRWRLDARVAALELSRAEQELERQALLVWPDLALGLDAERTETDPSLAGPSLELSLPVWNQNDPGTAAARFLLLQQRARYRAMLDRVVHEVYSAAANVRADEELLTLLDDELLPQASRAVASATRAYQAGQRDVGVLVQAQHHLVDEQQASYQVLQRHADAMAALERALGGRLADLLALPGEPEGEAATVPAADSAPEAAAESPGRQPDDVSASQGTGP